MSSRDLANEITQSKAFEHIITARRSELLNKAVYHNETKTWMVPVNDPYTLENCQRAYDNIAENKTIQFAMNDVQSEFTQSYKLEATHFALKIYPRNEEEQKRISQIDGINISYQPFGYTAISDESEINIVSRNRIGETYQIEKGKYSVTYTDIISTEGGPQGPITYNMPVMYMVWPANLDIPSSYDYEILYPVFLPIVDDSSDLTRSTESNKNSLSVDALNLLNEEAKSLAFTGTAYESNPTTRSAMPVLAAGSVKSYENVITDYVPIQNLTIRLQLGTFIKDLKTSTAGSYFYREYVDRNTTMTLIFEHYNFKVSHKGHTSPITFPLGTIGSRVDASLMHINLGWAALGDTYAFEAFRAANYYYLGAGHQEPLVNKPNGIRIEVSNEIIDGVGGDFNITGSVDAPFIRIYRSAKSPIGSTHHELGHFVNYIKRGSSMVSMQTRVKESYASYVGWHVGNSYYSSIGYTSSGDSTYQSRQYWSSSSNYTPIFVDLIDDYNQKTSSNNLVNDLIKNVPHLIIDRIINESMNMTDCRNILQEYVGTHYSQYQLDELLSKY